MHNETPGRQDMLLLAEDIIVTTYLQHLRFTHTIKIAFCHDPLCFIPFLGIGAL